MKEQYNLSEPRRPSAIEFAPMPGRTRLGGTLHEETLALPSTCICDF